MPSAVDEQAGAPAGLPDVAEVATDIRQIIGRCRSHGDWAAVAVPALEGLGAACGWPRDQLLEEIAQAIIAVESHEYRAFLGLLLPLPFVPGEPWSPLRSNRHVEGRGDLAARTAFGVTWDAANRAGQLLDGRSRRDWAEELLAEALLSRAVQRASQDNDAADASPAKSVVPAGRRRWPVFVASLLALATAAGVVLWWALRREPVGPERSGSAPTAGLRPAFEAHPTLPSRPESASCERAGLLDRQLGGEAEAKAISARFDALYERDGGLFGTGCPTAAAFRWDRLVIQELRGQGPDLPGAMVLSDEADLILPPAAYGGYRRLGSGNGSRAQSVGGAPVEVADLAERGVEVRLASGALMVAEGLDAPYFWIPAQYVDWWRRNTQLGRPAGNPMPTLTQDYEFGFGSVQAGGGAEPQPTVVSDRLAALPPIERRRSRLLRQGDGTAWWVGDDDRRYWVATGAIWECLGGSAALAAPEVPGYAIAALPYGGHASCPNGGDGP